MHGEREVDVELDGEPVRLTHHRGVYWPRGATLFVADPHVGKAAAFRSGGVPIPHGSTADDLARLDDAIETTGATRLVVLGDLLHARDGRAPRTLDAVAAWRARRPKLDVVLVRGNHDRAAGDPPPDWGVRCVDEPWTLGPFALRHHPDDGAERFGLAGHVHPGVRIGNGGSPGFMLPAMVVRARDAVLPAFGGFTGTSRVRPDRTCRVFAFGPDGVVEVPRP